MKKRTLRRRLAEEIHGEELRQVFAGATDPEDDYVPTYDPRTREEID
jgi:hypothetical protein